MPDVDGKAQMAATSNKNLTVTIIHCKRKVIDHHMEEDGFNAVFEHDFDVTKVASRSESGDQVQS